MEHFINRRAELTLLETRWMSTKSEFLVLYGRRRVGKSALINTFCRDRIHAYFLATRVTATDSLAAFKTVLAQATGNTLLEHLHFDSWATALEVALDVMTTAAQGARFCLILDEFQYLCEVSPELPSILQKWWDTKARARPCMLILCGSHISFMEREVLAERSPLFGRRTGQMRILPLQPWHAGLFLLNWSPLDRLKAFAVAGGVPAYLERFNAHQDLRSNVLREMLTPDGYLFDEVNFLLRTELGQAHTYMSLLNAIAGGATRISEIASRTQISVTSLAKPLNILIELGFVQRHVPFTEVNPHKSKRGVYRVSDPFTRFWCRYILPNSSLIMAGRGALVWDRFIEPDLPTFLGLVFEEVCRSFVETQADVLVPGEHALRVGSHWDRDYDVDVMATLTDGSMLIGECKAWSGPVGLNVLETLKYRQTRLAHGAQVHRVLFSASGFTAEVQAAAERGEVVLADLDRIMAGE